MPGNCENCCENINECVRRRRILFCSIFWILILGAVVVRVIKYYSSSSNVQPSHDVAWDYLLFAQSWPVGYCIMIAGKAPNPEDKCNIPKPDNRPVWVAHGIWPTRTSSKSPENCYLIPFNVSDLEPIQNELSTYWASTQKNSNASLNFWKHEWLKHGTCGVQSERLSTTFKYFSQGLDWYKQYNVNNTLASCGILPDDSKLYTNAQVVDCFKKHFDVSPQLSCKADKARNKQILQEVRLCFDKTLTIRSCDTFTSPKLCKGDFLYPASVALQV